MNRLSSSVASLAAEYDAVVVGSGYGGAIAACRLARVRIPDQEGADPNGRRLRVCVLERGIEHEPGEYPRTLREALRQLRVEHRFLRLGSETGLYDLHVDRDISVFAGRGLGGTSLINANVILRPDPWVFEDARWPDPLRNDGELERGFERARGMLDPQPYPEERAPLPKLLALQRAGSGDGAEPVERAPVTVAFRTRVNAHGVQERACVACGDCMMGCNHGAKRTLLATYLPDAVRHGAEVYCGISVRAVEPRDDGGWLVHFHPVDGGRARFGPPEMFVHARIVVLGAGALGSTEILLRSRRRGHISGSAKLGHSFSGNGDTLAFAYNGRAPVDGVGFGSREPGLRSPVGPTITGVLDERRKGEDRRRGVVIQEGTIPGALAPLLGPFLFLAARWSRKEPGHPLDERLRELGREVVSLLGGAYRGAVRNTLTFLTMGHERSSGILHLHRDRIRIHWPGVGRQRGFTAVAARLENAVRRLGGTHVVNPIWRRALGRRLITVHPLGGCPTGRGADRGAVNHKGQLFRRDHGDEVHENLYVVDGSVVRRSLGVNPLWTICAIAERTCVLLARDRGWRIAGIDEAEDGGKPGSPGSPPPRPGIRFSERMTGALRTEGEAEGPAFPFEFTATMISDDLEALVGEGGHEAGIVGTAQAPFLSPHPLTISEGTFRLFEVDETRVETVLMRYDMKLVTRDGRNFRLKGLKTLRDRPWSATAWRDVTRMDFTLSEERPNARVPVGEGTLRIRLLDLVRLLIGITPTHLKGRLARARQRLRFARHFLRTLFRVYAWPVAPSDVIDPLEPLPPRRTLRLPPPEAHPFTTADGADIHLERYRGSPGGVPVIAAPGFGTSTYAFALPTIGTNLAEYLVEKGYDVWLLDYRASERSAAAGTQFTLDDIARYDWPAAVDHVHRETGLPVHLLGHCVASMTALMALLAGHLDQTKVRSLICSQSFTHVEQSPLNRLRAHLRLATLVGAVGFWPTLNPSYDLQASPGQRIGDLLLRVYPSSERCRTPVCRRILFLYGEVFRHEHLDAATHRAVYDMFDRANLTTFRHLALITRMGRLVDARGRNTYLRPQNAARIRVPVTLLQGPRNLIFRPAGGDRSLAWLRAHGDPDLFQLPRDAAGLEAYGHMDLFIGRNASRDVFPVIGDALTRAEEYAERRLDQPVPPESVPR